MDIEFLDELPPSLSGRKRDPVLVEFADALRANPGKWAPYPKPIKNGGNHAVQINMGRYPTLGIGFRAVCRQGTCYVGYVGDQA
jgi:hypothetical protein